MKIGEPVYTPLGFPYLIEEAFRRIIELAKQIKDLFEQSFFLMVHLPYLQTFEDVNKRVSRLALNIPLLANNLSPLSFMEVTEKDYVQGLLAVYELNRIELLRELFIWGYYKSCGQYGKGKELGQPNLFLVKHRQLVKEVVREIIQNKMNRSNISVFLKG